MPRKVKLSQAEQEQIDIQAGKYRATVINDALAKAKDEQRQHVVDVTNRPIADKLHTFVNEISNEILEAERAESELLSIRATLLVNFMEGSSHNHFGFTIPNNDKVSTEQLVIMVLEHFVKGK